MLAAPIRAAAMTPVGRPRLPACDDVSSEHNELGLDDRLLDQVRAVAPLDTTVMITGETGAGKTRLARLIHALSPRRNKQFLAVNCGALSESLLDSELFGHTKGAFTGADRDHAGKLTQCQNGTLLLDEIDTLSPAAQVKLLQVTDDRVFQPVGATTFQPLRARLVGASNKSLETEVAAGRFRSDLYFRLNVMSFQLPPLRERRHEIPRLVRKFAAEFAGHHDIDVPSVLRSALSALESHTWPGNIRELRNVMERAVILSAGGAINHAHLPSHIVTTWDAVDSVDTEVVREGGHNKLATARGEAEREQLLLALELHNNNRTKTASYLGISRVALYKRLRKFHIL
jgi:DNA-binding NtrC family response regulator